jgi:hypothetical protein
MSTLKPKALSICGVYLLVQILTSQKRAKIEKPKLHEELRHAAYEGLGQASLS